MRGGGAVNSVCVGREGAGAAALSLLLLLGCTSITVEPVPASEGLRNVCIERNPEVIIDDFLDVLRVGFLRHGIESEVVEQPAPERCEFVLRYTALRSWDIATFLSHAELYLERSGRPIAHAIYHLRAKGGYALTKYQSTRKKMNRVIDELLAQYPPASSAGG
jgi:hypothetical protein